ncbi:transcriptional regulator [Eoetvoesiella caeni]|uniref:Uncharacterized protein n=1 Tax=Eoetvoesiella caeni TaxID=645616 RepID=A0A366HBJ7_9BURK|nr:transcriptional regulator [Eoetvoesiella caeni]MCI2809362.1 transcriptional regulator [Eoetvoesiella caeni]NYT54503.1 transcriptional regulator [Eoetvoesiella caeni]RBP39308.1 hypothetical protein DFR37_105100 [Eoetvoesiella caeni]
MGSNINARFEDPAYQVELALTRRPTQADVAIETVRKQRSAAAAFTLACGASGLEDKEIYLAIGIDAGYFSNIKKGKATLQADLVSLFCKQVGNTIYPEWQAYQLGCTLVMIKSEAERRIEDLQSQLDKERERRAWAEDIALGRRAAA